MHNEISVSVAHLSESQQKLVRIMEAEKYVVRHLAGLIAQIPDELPFGANIPATFEHASLVTKSVAAYLNSLADLEDALIAHLELAIREMNEPSHDE